MAWLPNLDQMVFLDGNSTDGTTETIERVRDNHPLGKRIRLVKDCDPDNLQDDYVFIQNKALHSLDTEFAFFLHPDMFPISGMDNLRNLDGVAYFKTLETYGGDPLKDYVYEMQGRATTWKSIMRLKEPNLGLHYFGHYGAWNEDMYFSDITGNAHEFHSERYSRYPYEVKDSGLKVAHFSDVRTYERRVTRMISCLLNNGMPQDKAEEFAPNHPRVNFISSGDIKVVKTEMPDCLLKARENFIKFEKGERCFHLS